MLGRNEKSISGQNMPQDWLEGLSRLLNESYKNEVETHNRYFDIFGKIYEEELLLVVSWLSVKDQFELPIACFLSCDAEQMNSEKKVKDTQDNFIELVGLFFDEIFASEDWSEFEPVWQPVTHKAENYWFKLSRENVNLTIEADRLLGEDF